MRRFSLVSMLCLAASLSSLVACAASSDASEDTDSSEADIKRKVKPTGGNGAFDLAKPTWATAGAVGQYVFDGRDVAIGSRTEKVPGNYAWQTRGNSFEGSQTMGQNADPIAITAGNVVTRTTTGLRVRYDQPLTLGFSTYSMQPVSAGSTGWLRGSGPWARQADGVLMLVAPGKFKATAAADGVTTEVTLTEGKLNEVVLPTAKVSVDTDQYDPDYPTSPNCSAAVLIAGAPGETEQAYLRNAAGTGIATQVIPHGARTTAILDTYGVRKTVPTVAGQTIKFVVNRLEVDDVEVRTAGGGTQLVKGTFTVEYKDAGGAYRMFNCGGLPTHTGLDLLDGAYRVTSRANSASGVVTHVEEFTFP